MTKDHIRRVGLNARSLDDFFRYAKLDGINLIEINPGAFDKNGSDMIWTYNKGIWKINRDVAKRIQDTAGEHDIQVQLHIPYEETNDPTKEKGLCQAVKGHHQALLDRYKMLNDLLSEYSIGMVITTHPPSYLLKNGPVCSLAQALESGRQFYFALDEMIKEQGFGFKVGIENVSDPKNHHAEAGYDIAHLRDLLGNTEEIGLTVDAGHRLLAKNMSVSRMFALAPIVNLHFHLYN